MATIQVDFEVYKEITLRRESETVSENDVIRKLLGLDEKRSKNKGELDSNKSNGIPWINKGVTFPHGTKFRATYKGQHYTAQVENGALLLNGKSFNSPSAAAISITRNSVNGWMFWECQFPNSNKWELIANLRNS